MSVSYEDMASVEFCKFVEISWQFPPCHESIHISFLTFLRPNKITLNNFVLLLMQMLRY